MIKIKPSQYPRFQNFFELFNENQPLYMANLRAEILRLRAENEALRRLISQKQIEVADFPKKPS